MSDAGKGFVAPATEIDAATLAAYLETDYRVHGDPERGIAPFTLRVDAPCPALAAEHARRRVESSAYVTACNPLGRPLDACGNAALHAALVRTLRECGLELLEGVGQHPSNGWPGEASCLVFGPSREAAGALGARLRQNAVLWSGPDAVPRLLLLR